MNSKIIKLALLCLLPLLGFGQLELRKVNAVITDSVDCSAQTCLNIKDFGAKCDGITDDSQAYLDAATFIHTSPIKTLLIPAGRSILKKPVVFSSGTRIIGVGKESIIDGSTADSAMFPPPINQIRSSLITIAGTEPQLIGTVGVKPLFGDASVTLTAPVSLSKGDIILLTDTNAYSYSLFRPEYKQGEILRAASAVTSGTTINLEGVITGSLYKNNPLVYRMAKTEGSISGLTILAPNDGFSEITALRFEYITNGTIENIYASNSNYAIISINNCSNILVNKVFLNKSLPDISGTSYGIIIGDAEDVIVTNSEIYSARHGLTTGGGGKYTIVTRRVKADNCVLSTHGGIGSFDFHGNTEYSGVYNSTLNGGLTLAGRLNTAQNNTIFQDVTGNETAISLVEVVEPSFEISSNLIYSYKPTLSGGMWLRMEAGNNTEYSGLISIHDNKFNFVNKPASTMFYSGLLINYVGSVTNQTKVSIKNNEFVMSDNIANSRSAIIISSNNAVYQFQSVEVHGNVAYGGNIFVRDAKGVSIFNNTIYNALYHGIGLSKSKGEIASNRTYNTNVGNSGSSSTNAAILLTDNTKISVRDNFGSNGMFTTYGVAVDGVDTLILSNNKHGVNLREYNFANVSLYDFDILSHNLAPNSNIAAKVGSVYIQDSGASGNVIWTKIAGTGNTGWDQVITSTNIATLTNKTWINTSLTGTTILTVVEYADNAAAIAGGLAVGSIYRTGDLLKIVH